MKHSFANISTDSEQFTLEDKFVERYNDSGEAIYVSKRTFNHVEEGLSFRYKYLVEVCDMRELCGEDKVCVNLYIVPTLQSLTESGRRSVLSGFESGFVPTFDLTDEIHRDGYSICMGGESFDMDEETPWDEDERFTEALNTAANVFETINSLRGFYLDRVQNGIGNDGWDFLKDYINDEPFMEAAFQRYGVK